VPILRNLLDLVLNGIHTAQDVLCFDSWLDGVKQGVLYASLFWVGVFLLSLRRTNQ
jgi:hypothetical protein